MHQRSTLASGEDTLINGGAVCSAREGDSAARTAQRLMRGARHNVCVRERRGMKARRNDAGDVRHINHQLRTSGVGDRSEAFEVQGARIG